MEDLELQTAVCGTTVIVEPEFDDEGDILIAVEKEFDMDVERVYISKESAKALADHLLAAIEADNAK